MLRRIGSWIRQNVRLLTTLQRVVLFGILISGAVDYPTVK